ncbi:MAG: TldD/PmbA family protein [Candidatus Kapabacteria bacterium]|nr:TldD/PmbA family protein [Candidatus Kapabacteria bacterium]MCS7169052.1 TldD/PmbA family protein [Candidatus Kapabacteria bacterium]MDW7997285.1 TldD/PmbA family protein [Bacteroidota bacterium]MDW8224998.1 TldD/PmbA family protein [Bacteroidota bacterium]
MLRVSTGIGLAVFGFLAAEASLLTALREELERNAAALRKQVQPAYFVAYQVTDLQTVTVEAQAGKLRRSLHQRSRWLDVDVRVGSYELDNTRPLQEAFRLGERTYPVQLPLGEDGGAIRHLVWQATMNAYDRAAEEYAKVVAGRSVRVQESDSVPDFSREQPRRDRRLRPHLQVDTAVWARRLRELSALFADHPWIYSHRVSLQANSVQKFLLNTEGTELAWSEQAIFLSISAQTRADDGMELPLYRTYFAFQFEELPSLERIQKDIVRMIELLRRLREAAVLETYSGPAILSGEAAGVFFHEILGHRVEGHRQKDPGSAQMLRDLLGKQILPSFLDVVFDPTQRYRDGIPLAGSYPYDDEGVPGQRVLVVERGILRGFILNRTPVPGFSQSNGHGRRQSGLSSVARQSNLLVLARETVSPGQLRLLLREECRRQGKEFGLLFDVVEGGFTFTARTIPNAFNVMPLVVYKVYADERPDELVRGIDLIGTPLMTFAHIVAAGSDVGIFNGICGAESGSVPVSSSSPSLLVSRIEVQKKAKSDERPPILPPPSVQPAL